MTATPPRVFSDLPPCSHHDFCLKMFSIPSGPVCPVHTLVGVGPSTATWLTSWRHTPKENWPSFPQKPSAVHSSSVKGWPMNPSSLNARVFTVLISISCRQTRLLGVLEYSGSVMLKDPVLLWFSLTAGSYNLSASSSTMVLMPSVSKKRDCYGNS